MRIVNVSSGPLSWCPATSGRYAACRQELLLERRHSLEAASPETCVALIVSNRSSIETTPWQEFCVRLSDPLCQYHNESMHPKNHGASKWISR